MSDEGGDQVEGQNEMSQGEEEGVAAEKTVSPRRRGRLPGKILYYVIV